MKQQKFMVRAATIATLSLLALSGCGGGSSSNSSGSGKLNLAVTDAPVDDAKEVVVTFSGVELKPASGAAIVIDFSENKQIDLLKLQGGEFEFLTEDYTLPAGDYEWVRLKMVGDKTSTDSYIKFKNSDTLHPLYAPDAKNSHGSLKLDKGNFIVLDGGVANLTIDFDLRKSIVDPKNASDAYMLKPVLRLVQNATAGHIKGNIASDFYTANPACSGAVYLYAGAGATPTDFGGALPAPISSGLVKYNDTTMKYEYGIGFVEAGNYTVSFTCDADKDVVDQDDSGTVHFLQTADITVEALHITEHNFVYTP